MQIKIDHIAKIEGHAGFTADIAGGKIGQVRLEIREGARLLEGILRGRNLYEVSQISARICGVCPVVHTFTSLKALEKALKIEISETTLLLRELMMMGQIINSHALHLFFFSLADFFGAENDLDLIKKFPHAAKDALFLRKFGNDIIEAIGGRSIHPLTPTIGGFLRMPEPEKLNRIFRQCHEALAASMRLAEIFSKLKYPDFIRSAPFASLSQNQKYAIYDGQIKTSTQSDALPSEFMGMIQEYQLENSKAVKGALYNGNPYMVGAISRINNNSLQLHPEAYNCFRALKISVPSFNPFHNIPAQAIEMIHCVEEAEILFKKTLAKNLDKNDISEYKNLIAARLSAIQGSVSGVAATEAPRGTLYYSYRIDSSGSVLDCDIITPTSQNLARLERDLEEYLSVLIKAKSFSRKIASEKIKMLVRAYDPCLTCATH